MPVGAVMPSGEALTSGKAKFISLSRIIRGVADYDVRAAAGEDVRQAIAQHAAATLRAQRRRPLTSGAARLLRIAWQSELVARLGEQLDDPGLRQATLQTLPVQTYYAVFSASRAVSHVATPPEDKHHQVHERFASGQRRLAFGAWGVSLSGDPEDVATCDLEPPICSPVVFNPMEMRTAPEEYVWAALRMARRWRIERARGAWIADKQNRTSKGRAYKVLPAHGRRQVLAAERSTTLMDFVYELRCGSNYRSIDEYAVEIDDSHVIDFHSGLLGVLDSGIAYFEGYLARYVGTVALRSEFTDWSSGVRGMGTWASRAAADRIDAFAAAGL